MMTNKNNHLRSIHNQNVMFYEINEHTFSYKEYTDIISVLQVYFVKDYITLGTLVRKIEPFLFTLQSVLDGSIEAVLKHDEENDIFRCIVSRNNIRLFKISILSVTSGSRRSIRHMLNQLFAKDKFYASPHTSLVVRCKNLTYSKKKLEHGCRIRISPIHGWQKITSLIFNHYPKVVYAE